jgi:3-mercaptopropionate dioxygenase
MIVGKAGSAMDLKNFCKTVGRLVADNPVDQVPGLIAEYLPEILIDRTLLGPEHKALPPEGYGRHDVFLCPNDDFSIIAAVWPAGIVSPIHDHQTWCTFGVFEGVIQETRYRAASDDPRCLEAVAVETVNHLAGDVAHLPVGGGDIHCMHNPTDHAAVSVHIYGGNSVKLGPNVVKVYQEVAAAFA